MDNTQSRNETLVFGLDIGTRSIVGVVGYMERNRFKVIAMAEQKHETRAMLEDRKSTRLNSSHPSSSRMPSSA